MRRKDLFSLLLAAFFLVSVSGCQEKPTEGAEYARSLGWYDEMIEGFQITTKEQVDALQPGVAFPNVSVYKNGVTVTVLQTVANQNTLYFLVEAVIDPDVLLTASDPLARYTAGVHKAGENPIIGELMSLRLEYPHDHTFRKDQRRYRSIHLIRDYSDYPAPYTYEFSLEPGTLVSLWCDSVSAGGQHPNSSAEIGAVHARLTWAPYWGDIPLLDSLDDYEVGWTP